MLMLYTAFGVTLPAIGFDLIRIVLKDDDII